MSTLDASRHLTLSRKFLKLLTPGDVWKKWSQYSSSDITPNATLDCHLFCAYNMRARTPAEQERIAWRLLLQQSIRQCIFGEESQARTVWLDCSTEDVDNQVFCFRYSVDGDIGFILYTFDEPERSRHALRALYCAQHRRKFIPVEDILAHVNVSYVNVANILHFPFVIGLVFRTDKKSVRAYNSPQNAIEHAAKLKTLNEGDQCTHPNVEMGMHSPALHNLDAKEGHQEYKRECAPIVLSTDAQRWVVVMDNIAVAKAKRAEYYESDSTTPVSEAEEYFSSGDDTLAPWSGMSSSTHSFFSGDTHNTDTVDTSKEEDTENKYEIHDGDDHEEHDIDFGVPAGGDMYHNNDGGENSEIVEDNEDTNNDELQNEGQEGNEVGEYVEEIAGADEFGVVRRRNGAHFGYDGHTPILVPPEPHTALERSPSKKVLRALRTMLGM